VSYLTHADLGGTDRPGPIVNEPEDSRFHAEWERRTLALTLAMGATGEWNIDMSRAARETLPDYNRRSYYAIWLAALEELLLERGLVTPQELAAGHAQVAARPLARVLTAADVAPVLQRGSPTERAPSAPARFAAGDAVVASAVPPDHHTRLPGYARGRRGVVERVHGVHVFADAHAHGLGERPQWLYGVRFEGRELWGAAGSADAVSIDIWESLLEPAP
jgi:nitrile hydratase